MRLGAVESVQGLQGVEISVDADLHILVPKRDARPSTMFSVEQINSELDVFVAGMIDWAPLFEPGCDVLVERIDRVLNRA